MPDDPANAGVGSSRIPFCDLRCPQAEFPKQDGVDGSGSCRTFAAIWCRELGQYTTKNAPCAVMSPKAREAAAEKPVVKKMGTRTFNNEKNIIAWSTKLIIAVEKRWNADSADGTDCRG
jgi:hypothetical protein